MIKNGWVLITTAYMNGVVTETAPILKRFKGMRVQYVKKDIGKCAEWKEYEET